MKMIAAVDQNWGIGYQNRLLVQIPQDMNRFKELTQGQVVFMGKNTLLSLPGSLPLKNRTNIVLTSDRNFSVKGAVIVHDREEALAEMGRYSDREIYLIGGASVYEQFLNDVNEVFLTCIQQTYHADAYFPDLTRRPEWVLAEESKMQRYSELEYSFRRYIRK